MKRIGIIFGMARLLDNIWKGALMGLKGLGMLALLAFLVVNFTLTTSELAEKSYAARKLKVDPMEQAIETNFYHDLFSTHFRPLFKEIELDPSENYHVSISYYSGSNGRTSIPDSWISDKDHGDFRVKIYVSNKRGSLASGPNRGWYDFTFNAEYQVYKRVPTHKDPRTKRFKYFVKDVEAELNWLRYNHEEMATDFYRDEEDYIKKRAGITYTRTPRLAEMNKVTKLKARDAADRIFQYLKLEEKLNSESR